MKQIVFILLLSANMTYNVNGILPGWHVGKWGIFDEDFGHWRCWFYWVALGSSSDGAGA